MAQAGNVVPIRLGVQGSDDGKENQDTIDAIEKLLRDAIRGDIIGLAYIVGEPVGPGRGGAVGSCIINPGQASVQLLDLSVWLGAKAG